MQNYKKDLPINLDSILAIFQKIDWYRLITGIQKIKKVIAVFKAIASYATPEEKEQLATIYANVLARAKAEKEF